MSFLSRDKSNVQSIAVFDIRSGSVGAALLVTKTKKPEVIWADRHEIDFLTEHDSNQLLDLIQQALSDIATKLRTKGLKTLREHDGGSKKIDKAVCILAAPWYIGSTQQVTVQKKNPFPIDDKHIEKAVERARTLFVENSINNHTKNIDELEDLDKKIIGMWANGYHLNQPQNVTTTNLKLATYMSMLPQRVNKIVQNVIGNVLHVDKLELASATAAVTEIFTNYFEHPQSFLIVDASEELTEILLIDNGILVGSVSYPLGQMFILREAAKSLDRPIADLRSRLRNHKKEEKEILDIKEVGEVFEDACERWQQLFCSSLSEFSADISIPSHVYVLSQPGTSSLFANLLKDTDISEQLLTKNYFRIHEVTDKLLGKHLRNSTSKPLDHFLAINLIFAEKHLRELKHDTLKAT